MTEEHGAFVTDLRRLKDQVMKLKWVFVDKSR